MLTVARAELDNVHCVPEVTSTLVPSLRCDTAFRTAMPPVLTFEGVAVMVREVRFWNDPPPHPAARNKPHRNPKRTCGLEGILMDCLANVRKVKSSRAGGRRPFQGVTRLPRP